MSGAKAAKRLEDATTKGGAEQVKKKVTKETKSPAKKVPNFLMGFNPETKFRGENEFSDDDDDQITALKKVRIESIKRFKQNWASQRDGDPQDEFFLSWSNFNSHSVTTFGSGADCCER